MKSAVVYEFGAPVELAEVTVGPLREGDVRIAVVASGLCHSDLAAHAGMFPVPRPIAIGHEGAGVVEEVGANVTSVKAGDHVVLSMAIGCGRCRYCTKGVPMLCDVGFKSVLASLHIDGGYRLTDARGRGVHQFGAMGTLSDQIIVPEQAVVKIPRDIPMDVACLLGCGVTTGLGAVFNTARLRPGARIAVVGAGGIGLNVIQAARISGAYQIIAIDPIASKRVAAHDFGATETLDPGAGPTAKQVIEATGGVGVDFAFECVGLGSLVRECWDMIALDGTVVAIGVSKPDDGVTLPAIELATTEKRLLGCALGSSNPVQAIPQYLQMYQAGQLKLDSLIGGRYTLETINEAIHDLESGALVGRGVISITA